MWEVFKVFLRLIWRRDSDSAVHVCIVLDQLLTQKHRLDVADFYRSSHAFREVLKAQQSEPPQNHQLALLKSRIHERSAELQRDPKSFCPIFNRFSDGENAQK